jgi:hypothetical protein
MNRNPTPRHSEQILLRSNPVAPQEAHSSQSAMFVALWFIPWQRSSPMILLQRPFATVALYPAAPHSVQHVFGNSLFKARRYLLTKRGHILPEQPMATSTPYLSLAKTLADRRINNLQQSFQPLVWYNCVPCSACFFSGSEP